MIVVDFASPHRLVSWVSVIMHKGRSSAWVLLKLMQNNAHKLIQYVNAHLLIRYVEYLFKLRANIINYYDYLLSPTVIRMLI